MATRLGTTVEELAPHVVRHVQIKAVAGLALLVIVSAVAAPLLFLQVRSALKKDWAKATDAEIAAAIVPIAVLSITCLTALLLAAAAGPNHIAAALEPTGATVRMLLRGVGK